MSAPTFDELEVKRLGLTQPFQSLVNEGKPLRAFQLMARRFGIQNKRIILSLDKGLGKTLTVLSIFESEEVHQNQEGFTVLILCPEKGIGSWLRDIQTFPEHADKFQVVLGTKDARRNQWRNNRARYFICTVDTFLSDMGVRLQSKDGGNTTQPIVPSWLLDGSLDALVLDEFHRKIRRHQSASFKLLSKWANAIGTQWKKMRPIDWIILMSGSAVSKGPQDIYAALHILDPKLWSSYWKYVGTWCELEESHFGKKIVGPKANRVEQWRRAVGSYVFHRTKEMVGNQLPPKSRFIMDVDMPKWQRDLHDQMMRNQFMEWEDNEGNDQFAFAQNALAKLHKIRTLLICPKAIDESLPYGPAIEDIYDTNLESGITRYLVCTPFKSPIPYLAAYLRERGARVWTLQGGIGLEAQERILGEWRASLVGAEPERPSVVLSTVKYAESWELLECSYGYMLGYEWDPEDNKQAEDRINRLASTDPAFWYYIRHRHAYDDELITMLTDKAAGRELTWSAMAKAQRAAILRYTDTDTGTEHNIMD